MRCRRFRGSIARALATLLLVAAAAATRVAAQAGAQQQTPGTDAVQGRLRDAFEALGGAWRPRSRVVLEELLKLPARLADIKAHKR